MRAVKGRGLLALGNGAVELPCHVVPQSKQLLQQSSETPASSLDFNNPHIAQAYVRPANDQLTPTTQPNLIHKGFNYICKAYPNMSDH